MLNFNVGRVLLFSINSIKFISQIFLKLATVAGYELIIHFSENNYGKDKHLSKFSSKYRGCF